MMVKGQPSSDDLDEIVNASGNRYRKQNLGRTLKMAILITCMTGFGYQTKETLTNFFSYPTVLNTAVEIMKKFPTPALTFCSKFLYDFQTYCIIYRDRCPSLKDTELFCQEHPLRCVGNKTFAVTPTVFPYEFGDFEIASSPSDVFSIERSFQKFQGPFPYHYKDHVTKGMEVCYRLGTGYTETGLHKLHIGGIRSKEWAAIETSFGVSEFIYFNATDQPFGTLYIHSPFLSFTKHTKSVIVNPGYFHEVYIRLEAERLLPFPYETDCEDYEALWVKNNQSGPLSREMCQHECLTADYEYFETGFYEQAFSVYENTCNGNAEELSAAEQEFCNCFKGCKDECLKLNYHFITLPSKAPKSFSDENKGWFVLFIESNKVRFTYHRAQYMDVEVFSYVGGLLGCWLGISIWTSTGLFSKGCSVLETNIKDYRKTVRRDAKFSKKDNSCSVKEKVTEEVE